MCSSDLNQWTTYDLMLNQDGFYRPATGEIREYLVPGIDFNLDAIWNGTATFNGSSASLLAAANTLETNVSVEFFFKTTALNTGLYYVNASSGGNDRHLYLKNGYLGSRVWQESARENLGNRFLADGNWHHVARTISSTEGTKIYIDGVLVDTSSSRKQSDFNWDDQVYWGVSIDSSSPYFNGQMDAARMWNRVLNGSEIQSLVTLGRAASDSEISAATSGSQPSLNYGFNDPANPARTTGSLIVSSTATAVGIQSEPSDRPSSELGWDQYSESQRSRVLSYLGYKPLYAAGITNVMLNQNRNGNLTTTAIDNPWADSPAKIWLPGSGDLAGMAIEGSTDALAKVVSLESFETASASATEGWSFAGSPLFSTGLNSSSTTPGATSRFLGAFANGAKSNEIGRAHV